MKDLRSKFKDAFDRNKPAFIAVGLLLLGGLAAVTHLPGMRAPRERRAKGVAGQAFKGRMERWKAPSLERSEPEALIQSGGVFGKPEEAGAKEEVAADSKTAGKRAPGGRGTEDGNNAADMAGGPGAFDGKGGSGRLGKVKGFDNGSGASAPGGGASASASSEGSRDPASSPGGVSGSGGTGPLATLRRNLSILARRASRIAGVGAGRSSGGAGPRAFDGNGAGGFSTQAQGSAVGSGGDTINRSLGASAGSMTLARSPSGSSSGGTGGGGGPDSGGGGGDTTGGAGPGGGDTGGEPPGTDGYGTGAVCEARCEAYCKKSGHPGGQCQTECVKREHCHDDVPGGGEKEECFDVPDFFEDVPNLFSFVQTAASDKEGIESACAEENDPGGRIMEPTSDPSQPYREIGSCPTGKQPRLTNHPEPGDRACFEPWLDGVIKSLQEGPDGYRWGYVCRRGNCGNLSTDKIGFYAGTKPKNGGRDVRVIDIIQDCGLGGKNAPQWLVFCWNPKSTDAWRCSRDGKKCPTATPSPTPAPTTPPSSRPTCRCGPWDANGSRPCYDDPPGCVPPGGAPPRPSCDQDPEQPRCQACISAGTPVLSPGGERAIEALVPGDRIYSVDEGSGRLIESSVTRVIDHGERATLRFTLENGTSLVATGEHPLWDSATKAYRLASTFKPGERLAVIRAGALSPAVIASVEPGPSRRVIDISVDGAFRNFVAGGILVHNKRAPTRDE